MYCFIDFLTIMKPRVLHKIVLQNGIRDVIHIKIILVITLLSFLSHELQLIVLNLLEKKVVLIAQFAEKVWPQIQFNAKDRSQISETTLHSQFIVVGYKLTILRTCLIEQKTSNYVRDKSKKQFDLSTNNQEWSNWPLRLQNISREIYFLILQM